MASLPRRSAVAFFTRSERRERWGQSYYTEQIASGTLMDTALEMLHHDTARASLMNRSLTPRQQQVYDFIREKIVARGFGPTVREIGDYLKISSPNGVVCHLKALERKGMINRLANKSRAIELTEIISRDKQYSLPLGGRILGDICSFSVDPGSTVELLRFVGEDRFAVKVVGDSLKEAHIAAGDSLIIQRQSTASAGQMVLAKMPHEGTQLVYWMPESNGVRLQALDRKAAARFVESAEVVGVVIGLFREF